MSSENSRRDVRKKMGPLCVARTFAGTSAPRFSDLLSELAGATKLKNRTASVVLKLAKLYQIN